MAMAMKNDLGADLSDDLLEFTRVVETAQHRLRRRGERGW